MTQWVVRRIWRDGGKGVVVVDAQSASDALIQAPLPAGWPAPDETQVEPVMVIPPETEATHGRTIAVVERELRETTQRFLDLGVPTRAQLDAQVAVVARLRAELDALYATVYKELR